MKVINLVSKFIVEKRGHPLAVTVPEAQLLHDFATWVDKQSRPTPTPKLGGGTGEKLKLLNKETVSTILLGELNLSAQEVGLIVDIAWNSDELLQQYQATASAGTPTG